MVKMNRLVLLAVCVAPAAIYVVLQGILRANFGVGDGVPTYLVGIAANFLGAIGISAIIFVPLEFFRPERPVRSSMIMSAAITVMILAVREFAQISTGGTFDVNDLIWTVLGGGAFYGIGHWLILTQNGEEPLLD
jgi:hypothetical protein